MDYYSATKIQQRVDNGGTVMARIIELKDGKIIETMSKGEVYYRENLFNTANASGDALLMEPLRAGTTWILSNGLERTISSVSKVVSTPAGSFLCIEVVTQGEFDRVTDYYAKDVGLVKSVFTSGGDEVSSSLKEIEVNASQLQTINFYYPNINDGKLYASGHIEMKEGETIPANFQGVAEIN